jgi:hypothetical protein
MKLMTMLIKHGVVGEIECYKAILVARSFTQTFGIDYNKTFALIAKFVLILLFYM